MAEQVNWEELLEKKYPSYRVEVQAFLDNAHISRSTDVSIEKIYEAIQDDPKVNAELKMLYHECKKMLFFQNLNPYTSVAI